MCVAIENCYDPSESRSKSTLQSSAVNPAKTHLVQDQNRSQQQSAIDVLRNMNIPGVEIYTPDDFHDLTLQEQAVRFQSFLYIIIKVN